MKHKNLSRRAFMAASGAGLTAMAMSGHAASSSSLGDKGFRRVIDITDLYHPPQDPGDNVDLIAAYSLPEVMLQLVVCDVTDRYRKPYINETNHAYDDPNDGRDPGFISVLQLNSIFGRDVPCAAGPYASMRSPDDTMNNLPVFQQQGVEKMLRILRESPEPVDITSFGSARPLAVAYNRDPKLLREKVRMAHMCIGAAPKGFVEWNVQLDPIAFSRVLRSDMNVAIYPCAGSHDAYDLEPYNTFWRLPNFSLIRQVSPPLQRYLAFAFERIKRLDFLRALEEDPPKEVIDRIATKPHCVWETDVWMQIANRRLVRRADGTHRIVPAAGLKPDDTIVSSELLPCSIDVQDDGQFDFSLTDKKTNRWIFHRADPQAHQAALIEALPALYASFKTP